MHRSINVLILSIALLPLALLLLLFGLDRINPDRRNRFWSKIALAVNTSLALVLGFLGMNAKAEAEEPTVTCYIMPQSDMTQIEQEFETSPDWTTLEDGLWSLEYEINSGYFDYNRGNELLTGMIASIDSLVANDMISQDDGDILKAYVGSRHEYYCCNVGSVLCYEAVAIPGQKELTKEEIIKTVKEIKDLYDEGKIGSEAYLTAVEKLETQLKTYTDKKDNGVLRQLLLDLADGSTGTYFDY